MHKSDVSTITKTAIKICDSILRLFRSSGQLLWTGFQKKCLTIYVGIYHFHETIGYVIIYNPQHIRKNVLTKIIKTLDILTSLENTTFIKYALIS